MRSTSDRVSHYWVVTTWIGDYPWTGKQSQYITDTKVNSAFYPFCVVKSSTGLSGWNEGAKLSPVRRQVTLGDHIWQVMLCSSALTLTKNGVFLHFFMKYMEVPWLRRQARAQFARLPLCFL